MPQRIQSASHTVGAEEQGRRKLIPILAAIVTLALALAPSAGAASRPLVFGPKHAAARVVLLHGLNGNPASMLTQPYVQLVHELARRYQVIVAPEPYDANAVQSSGDQAWFSSSPLGRGYGYRLAYMRSFRGLIAWADRIYGPKRLMVAGISWGGMHAMLAACYDKQVTAFAVSSPVVNPASLTEFAGDTLGALDPSLNGCTRRLDSIPGFIGWGDADVRVGTAPVEGLLARLPRVRSCRYHGLGHTSDSLTEGNMVRALADRRILGCLR